MRSGSLILSITISILWLVFFTVSDSKVYAADGRVNIGLPTADLTIFRTVWNLSCHPQNSLLHEVPHYVMYAPDYITAPQFGGSDGHTYESKGGCWAYHNEGNTNFVPHHVGDSGLAGSENAATLRPNSPLHHYTVLEIPNPYYKKENEDACKNGTMQQKLGASYKPRDEFCGPYLHFEGYARLKQLAISPTEKEVWYVENFIGGHTVDGKNVIDGFAEPGSSLLNTPLGTLNGFNLYSAILTASPSDNRNSIVWKICSSGYKHAEQPRLGDGGKNNLANTRPCWIGSGGDGRVFDVRNVPDPRDGQGVAQIFPNPLLFRDIPHNRFGRNPRNDTQDGAESGQFNVKHVREWFDDDQESRDLHLADPTDARYPNEDDRGDWQLDQADDDWVKCSGQGGQQDIFATFFDGEYPGKIHGGVYNSSANKTMLDYTGYRDYIKKFKEQLKARALPNDPDGNTVPNPVDASGAMYNIALAPVVPFECDYQPLAQDPGMERNPTTGMLDAGPNPAGKPQRLAALLNNWTTAQLGPTMTVQPPPPTATNTTTPRKLGDVDGSLKVDISDFNEVLGYFGRTTTPPESYLDADLDKSGRVWIEDFNEVLGNFGK